jgi:hypothetical protein
MSERKKIEDRLRKKEQEIISLEDKIKTAKVYVQALRDILKMLGSDVSEDNEADAEATLRSGSAVDQARRVILDRGVPVHIDEILAALGKDATREAKASLTSSIAAYVRRDEIFTRPAPNTFGLVELGHVSSDDNFASEPPPDFGREPKSKRNIDDEIPF